MTQIPAPTKTFEDLLVWQKAHAFVLSVYQVTCLFPANEIYGLTAQFRRATVSIAATIAEGFIKRGPADKLRYFNIAQGFLEECRYYEILSCDLGYRQDATLADKLHEVSKLLSSYSHSILNSNS